jgi:hypothetical protein
MTTATKVKPFRQELFEIEPVVDFLHEIAGFGKFKEVVRTSDGFFLGKLHGDIGFNTFLGEPSIKALARTKELLEKFSPENKLIAEAILRRFRLFI